MIDYRTGNLLADKADTLLNTVNTVGIMGKGIALAFKNAFPRNYQLYRQACQSGGLRVGQLLPVTDSHLLYGEKTIINFPTKTHWRLPAEYTYIDQGLNALREWLLNNPGRSLAMPALGCGNGGLEWAKVKSMIDAQLNDLPHQITVYEPP